MSEGADIKPGPGAEAVVVNAMRPMRRRRKVVTRHGLCWASRFIGYLLVLLMLFVNNAAADDMSISVRRPVVKRGVIVTAYCQPVLFHYILVVKTKPKH